MTKTYKPRTSQCLEGSIFSRQRKNICHSITTKHNNVRSRAPTHARTRAYNCGVVMHYRMHVFTEEKTQAEGGKKVSTNGINGRTIWPRLLSRLSAGKSCPSHYPETFGCLAERALRQREDFEEREEPKLPEAVRGE